jgi:signal transduction histidine kinase
VFDAAQVVREVTDLLQPSRRRGKITIAMRGTLPHPVNTDRMLIRQAVMNVLDNAVKYTTAGALLEWKSLPETGLWRSPSATAGRA